MTPDFPGYIDLEMEYKTLDDESGPKVYYTDCDILNL